MNINGQDKTMKVENGFIYFKLLAGSFEILLTLDMVVKKYQANQQIAHDFGKVAIQRGPIVYCVESMDQTEDVWKYQLIQAGEIAYAFDDKLLNGVGVIRAEAKVANGRSASVYQEYQPLTRRAAELKLIPYYAWANRGKNQMLVWIDQNDC
ncbi:TPA: hypothetical protein IX448_002356 [Enterococcus faecium]|uniref:beta-L-arabinofuranosidase domain-containing protein n=1 Tax=Enterococcus faecium TaxID=1352 RepID=UPI0015C50B64|nr:hypothetical protein [Enterococcus faecium]HAQ6708753.1 hypothetical protein [Enterococcus faecium]HBB8743020.1 glycoside hydrolase family 127 protein [Enterococcus faecium]